LQPNPAETGLENRGTYMELPFEKVKRNPMLAPTPRQLHSGADLSGGNWAAVGQQATFSLCRLTAAPQQLWGARYAQPGLLGAVIR